MFLLGSPPLRPPELKFARAEHGASAVEYGLLITGIAVLIAMVVFAFGGGVVELFIKTCDEVSSAAHTAPC